MSFQPSFSLENLIGKPYQFGGGDDAYDCWTLVCAVYRGLYGIELPPHQAVDETPKGLGDYIKTWTGQQHFAKVTTPAHGDVVTMSRSNLPYHVGVYLSLPQWGVIHATRASGVIWTPLAMMAQDGWKLKQAWRHTALA